MAKSDGKVKVMGRWQCPFTMRARIALNIKSVNYELVEARPWDGQSQVLHESKSNPVMVHGDKSICESLNIVEYIDEIWPYAPSIVPSDPLQRVTARFWAGYLKDQWFPSLKAIGTAEGEDTRKAAIRQVEKGLVLLEGAFGKCSKRKAFFGGDQIEYLDIAFGCFLCLLRVEEKVNGIKLLSETKTPNLLKWAHRFCSNAVVKDVMPTIESLIESDEIIMGRMKGVASPASKL
ncbi:glutathione S-transferase U17 [Gossypium raimondii]|uniref:Glutathione S-transferase n=3 Tax=Gossypium TaxID=3633 RepID=A0A0D2SFK8_GOSRA|nr:glutathione S-transferase U17 [Gossypium raimondii]KJB40636.1 hypothetical protein B456_007G072000 [Gossypium raimondii]